MKDIFELRKALLGVFDDIQGDKIDLKKAKELNNTAGKVIATVKTQLAYAQLAGKTPEIKFVADAEGK